YGVERFITKYAGQTEDCNLSCLYVIDAICRYSKGKFGDKDKYCSRFETNLEITFSNLCKGKSSSEKIFVAFQKTVSLWEQHQIFSQDKLQPLKKYLPANLDVIP